jgi:protein ImuB
MFAVLYMADFQLQAALRLEPEMRSRPVALLEERPGPPVVFQLTEAARRAGVEAGLTATQAMARCGGVALKTRARAQEETVTALLLQCAHCFSPNIEATAEGVCTLDWKGLAVEGEMEEWAARWAERVFEALERLQLEASIGVAETPFLAWQAARRAGLGLRTLSSSSRPFLWVQDAEKFVAALPLEALEPEAGVREILEVWGVATVGEFVALGKENIAQRLGSEGMELFDAATSRQQRPLKLARPGETFEERMDFEPPVESLEPLLFVLRRFVEELARRLEAVYRVTAELKLQLGLACGARYERAFVIPAPTGQVETLFRILQTHLENVRTDSPIAWLGLSALPGRAAQDQLGLFEAALRDPNQFHETLGRLRALLGGERVGTPRLERTHRPDSFRMELEGIMVRRAAEERDHAGGDPPTGPALRRFRPPLPATVETRRRHPALLRSAVFTGPIAQSRGPWRLSGNWWDRESWSREEWDVQTGDGGLWRLAREKEQWVVEGIFD